MYYNHNLRVNLKEWRNRLIKSSFDQFGNANKYFFDKIKDNLVLSTLLTTSRFVPNQETLNEVDGDNFERLSFDCEEEEAVFKYHLITFQTAKSKYNANALLWEFSDGPKNMERVQQFVEAIVDPIVNYLGDKLDETSSVLFLLERYKLRSEWFFKQKLNDVYRSNSSNGENKLEEDLRLFLFDQGIEYPFSTPLSASGRADVVSMLHTEDPLVLEIKIIDKEKNYGAARIKGGFAQVVKYADDYHKNLGYLVIFNFDHAKIEFTGTEKDNTWPQRIKFRDKIFYLITIDLNLALSASKTGTIKKLTISSEELTSTVAEV